MTPVALAPRESERPARLLTVSPHSASHARTAAAFASVRPGRWLVDLASPFFAHSAASVRFDIAITLSGRLRPNAAACRGHVACAELSCARGVFAASRQQRALPVDTSLDVIGHRRKRQRKTEDSPPQTARKTSPIYTHTHTCACAHTHTRTRTRAHPHRHTLSHTRTRMCIMPLTRMCIMPLYGCTCTHIGTRARTHRTRGRARTRTRTLSLTRTDACRLHAHTQTHKRELNEFVNNM
jgi:hypothetical protein